MNDDIKIFAKSMDSLRDDATIENKWVKRLKWGII